MKIFRLGEMFCGPGGIALGAKLSELRTNKEIVKIVHEWAIDNDVDACATFRANICPDNSERVICADVRKLVLENLAPINGFAFGFPCNDFSIVGEQRGINGKYGPLYTYGIRVLNYFQPDWFFAENVGGLQSADDGNTFIKILHALRNAGRGYHITTHMYKFENYGVPQMRHRIIIIGIRADLGLEFKVPMPTHIHNPMTSREALENPPIPENVANQELTKHSDTVIERLKYIRPNENAWNANIPLHLKLNVKKTRMSQIYRRLNPDKPSYTITGSGGGGTHVYHWKEHRALTNRERARLQTFPDEFNFCGSKESVRRQIGMAVPPKGVQVIFEALFKTFLGIAYPSVEPRWNNDLKVDVKAQSELINRT